MLYREIIAVCSEIHAKHINTGVWAERRIVNVNTFAASYLNTQGLNIASVDLSRSNFSIARAPLFQLKSAM